LHFRDYLKSVIIGPIHNLWSGNDTDTTYGSLAPLTVQMFHWKRESEYIQLIFSKLFWSM